MNKAFGLSNEISHICLGSCVGHISTSGDRLRSVPHCERKILSAILFSSEQGCETFPTVNEKYCQLFCSVLLGCVGLYLWCYVAKWEEQVFWQCSFPLLTEISMCSWLVQLPCCQYGKLCVCLITMDAITGVKHILEIVLRMLCHEWHQKKTQWVGHFEWAQRPAKKIPNPH